MSTERQLYGFDNLKISAVVTWATQEGWQIQASEDGQRLVREGQAPLALPRPGDPVLSFMLLAVVERLAMAEQIRASRVLHDITMISDGPSGVQVGDVIQLDPSVPEHQQDGGYLAGLLLIVTEVMGAAVKAEAKTPEGVARVYAAIGTFSLIGGATWVLQNIGPDPDSGPDTADA